MKRRMVLEITITLPTDTLPGHAVFNLSIGADRPQQTEQALIRHHKGGV